MGLTDGRPLTIDNGGLALEALLHLPADASGSVPGIVVCHPHPQHGGDMHNNVVFTLCEAAVEHGFAALRFNFRGVGASEGSYDAGRGERDDAAAALAHLRSLPEIDPSRVALAGYSFGAAVALGVSDPDIRALVAVSAPTIAGSLTVGSDSPALFVSGDRDEYSDPADLQRLADGLDGRAELVVMQGVDHFWWGSDARLAEAVSTFLSKHL